MTIIWQWIAVYVTTLVIAAACLPSELLAGHEKHSWRGRARAAVRWGFFLAGYVAAIDLTKLIVERLGLHPLFRIDLSWMTSTERWLLSAMLAVVIAAISGIIYEFFYYWFHRAQHAVPWLWRFHSIHHSLTELNAINCYNHWTEGLFRIPVVFLPSALLLKIDGPQLIFVTALFGTWAQFVHANAPLSFGPLDRFLVSPHLHRVHHSTSPDHVDKNFAGMFSLWDTLFGTLVVAKRDEIVKTGLTDRCEPASLTGFLLARFAER